MGAEQSSSRNGESGQGNGPIKRDYYEVLEIERQATDDEYLSFNFPNHYPSIPDALTGLRKPTGAKHWNSTPTETTATTKTPLPNSLKYRLRTKSCLIHRNEPGMIRTGTAY